MAEEARLAGARVLNNTPVVGKWEELALLREKGVVTPEFSLQSRGEGWHPRRNNHMGGHDFLTPPTRGDYYVRKVEVRSEFRVHILNGVSIRAGIKIHREGFLNPHPWVRSYDAGWRLEYGTACQEALRQAGRDLAKAAVEALGLDFGAVDLARKQDGTWCVFEVNRRPGLEGNTTRVFAEKLREIHDALEGTHEERRHIAVPEVRSAVVRQVQQPVQRQPVLLPVPRRPEPELPRQQRVPAARIPTVFSVPQPPPMPERQQQRGVLNGRRWWRTRKGNIIFRPPLQLRRRG